MTIERDTYRKTTADLDLMYNALKKQLESEGKHRQALDKELQSEIQKRNNCEEEMTTLRAHLQDSKDTVDALRQQLADVKALNLTMLESVKAAKDEAALRTAELASMAETAWNNGQEAQKLKASNDALLSERELLRQEVTTLTNQLRHLEELAVGAQTDVTIERQWREAIQLDFEKETAKTAALDKRVVTLTSQVVELELTVKKLTEENAKQKAKISDQESALLDLGGALSKSVVKLDDLNQIQESLKAKTWDDDSEVKNCRKCEAPFSLARRRVGGAE